MVCVNKGWYVKIIRPEMEDRDILPGVHPLDKKRMQEWCDEFNSHAKRKSDGREAVVTPY